MSLRPAPDTMSYLTGHLPVAQGVACYATLTREADRRRAEGDQRSRGQIMADTLVERVTGQAQAAGTPVEIELVMTDKTLLGRSEEPAIIVGYGPAPAQTGRDLIRDAADAWVRRLYTHPETGALVAMDSRRRLFTGQLRHFIVLTHLTCANPYCDAPVRHVDHPTPHHDGGQTSTHNGVGLCEACNYSKELPGWHAVVHKWSDGSTVLDLTSPTGHRHRSRAPDPPGAPDLLTRAVRSVMNTA